MKLACPLSKQKFYLSSFSCLKKDGTRVLGISQPPNPVAAPLRSSFRQGDGNGMGRGATMHIARDSEVLLVVGGLGSTSLGYTLLGPNFPSGLSES